ncbi:hypothetical protein [Cryptosporangium phraense]|uniref:Uncharacterized protein n=1 Tax=Cryptosporangium phraense TaxID=2593070 RepID=A0A545AR43_9ACTN|nr:hypothetical protein [Cryptosporangium phraense]TQS43787.1 hypothetical protein FL583_17285 [Cryptosporangium phraense]
MTELAAPARPAPPTLPRRIAATLLTGVVVSLAAALNSNPLAGTLLGACAAVVVYLDSAAPARPIAWLRTGSLVGAAAGLVNAACATLSRAPAVLGHEVVIGVGLSLGASWGLAGLILRQGRADLGALIGLLAGPNDTLTPEGVRRDLEDVPTPWRRFRYAADLVSAALRIRTHRLAATFWAPLDWVLGSDLRLFLSSALPPVGAGVYLYARTGSAGAIFDNIQNLAALGGAIAFVGDRLRRIRSNR